MTKTNGGIEGLLAHLESQGGVLRNTFNTSDPTVAVHLWEIAGHALFVAEYQNGGYGMYSFVGENDDPVEKDKKFIDALIANPIG